MRARVDGQVVSLAYDLQLDRQMRHDIEIVVDRCDDQIGRVGLAWRRRLNWRCGSARAT